MHDYGVDAARHYAAYRPPLHGIILSHALGSRHFDLALDIGCGTGQSTIALLPFSTSVVAVDKSAEMLAAAHKQAGISYKLGDESHLPVADQSIDIVTMAGVLPYMDLAALSAELQRVCRADAVLLAYDFRVDLEPVLKPLRLGGRDPATAYDHGSNLGGVAGITAGATSNSATCFDLNARQAGHLVLANEARFNALSKRAGVEQLPEFVEQTIRESSFSGVLNAELFWSLHRLEP